MEDTGKSSFLDTRLAGVDIADLTGNYWSSSKSATCILDSMTWRCGQHVFHYVTQIIGVCRYVMLKALTACNKFPEPRFHEQLDLGDFEIAFRDGWDGLREALRCNEDAWCMRQSVSGHERFACALL
jgi:hypothetical protein